MGKLSALPYSLQFSVRIEDYAVAVNSKHSYPLLGLDLIAEEEGHEDTAASFRMESPEDALKYLGEYDSIWVGQSLGLKTGDHVSLLMNDQVREYTVRGVYPDAGGNAAAIVMDIAAAQYALNRFGRVDRILAKVPQTVALEEWQRRFRASASGRGRSPSCGNGHGGKSPHAGCVSLELAIAELHCAGGRRISDLQHNFGIRGAQKSGDWHRAGSRREPYHDSHRISWGSSQLRRGWCAPGVGAGARDGHRRREIDVDDRGVLVCKQPTWLDCIKRRLGAACDGRRDWRRRRVGVFAGARSVARAARGSNGARTAGIRSTSSQDPRLPVGCPAGARGSSGFAGSCHFRQTIARLSGHAAANHRVGFGNSCFRGCDHPPHVAGAPNNTRRGSDACSAKLVRARCGERLCSWGRSPPRLP